MEKLGDFVKRLGVHALPGISREWDKFVRNSNSRTYHLGKATDDLYHYATACGKRIWPPRGDGIDLEWPICKKCAEAWNKQNEAKKKVTT